MRPTTLVAPTQKKPGLSPGLLVWLYEMLTLAYQRVKVQDL